MIPFPTFLATPQQQSMLTKHWLSLPTVKKGHSSSSLANPGVIYWVLFIKDGSLTLFGVCPAHGARCGHSTQTPGEASAFSWRLRWGWRDWDAWVAENTKSEVLNWSCERQFSLMLVQQKKDVCPLEKFLSWIEGGCRWYNLNFSWWAVWASQVAQW